MELLARGVPLRVACLEVGVSRSAGQIWKNGTTVRRRDGTGESLSVVEILDGPGGGVSAGVRMVMGHRVSFRETTK